MTLIDIWGYSPADDNGIITALKALDPLIYTPLRDEQYFLNRSGEKAPAPLVEHYADEETGKVTAAGRAAIAGIFHAENHARLAKMYDVYFTKVYEALENYDMTETRTPNLEDKFTPRQKQTSTSDAASYVYGVNTPADSDGAPEGRTHGAVEVTNEGSDITKKTGTEQLTRHGNIGVTTSQQMLQSELELRKWSYTRYIYSLLDEYLTIPIYEN